MVAGMCIRLEGRGKVTVEIKVVNIEGTRSNTGSMKTRQGNQVSGLYTVQAGK